MEHRWKKWLETSETVEAVEQLQQILMLCLTFVGFGSHEKCHTHTESERERGRETERDSRDRNSGSALGAKRNYLQKMKQIKQAKLFSTCPQESVIRHCFPSSLPLSPLAHSIELLSLCL